MTTELSRIGLVLAVVGTMGWALPAVAGGGGEESEAVASDVAEVPAGEQAARDWRSLPRKERAAREWRSLPKGERIARERRGRRPGILGH